MSNKRHKTNNKRLWVIYIAAVILIVSVLVIWSRHKTTPITSSTVATQSSPADNAANNTRKSSSSPATTLNNGPTTSTTTPNNSTSANTSNESITVTRAGVVGGNLQVGTLVNGGTSGTCTVNVTQAGQPTVALSNQIALDNNSYACPVFNLPLSDFSNQGEWEVSVTLNTGSGNVTSSWANNPVDLSNTP